MKTKRKSNILFIILLLTNSFFLITSTNLGENVVCKITQEQSIASLASYIEQTPIEITDNAGLLAYSSSGNGLEGSPYLISGYNITTDTSYSIYIHGASVTDYFSIESCYFNSSQYGIHIADISDNIATIKNNTFVDCASAAIFVDTTNNFTIEGNTFTNSSTAILVEAADEFLIQKNTISNCSSGIYANYYDGVFVEMNITATITQNNISGVAGEAIKINKMDVTSPSIIVDSISITDNIIENTTVGIHVLRSPNAIVENNKLTNVKTYAIELYSYYPESDAHDYSVKNNSITNSGKGISLEYNINNAIIEGNEITDTGMVIAADGPINLTIRSNIVHSSTQSSFSLFGVVNASIVDNVFTNGTLSISCSSEVKITGNSITEASTSIDIFESENVTICDNILGNNVNGKGINIYAIINLNITSNTLVNLITGIKLYADTARNLTDISITDNEFDMIETGIYQDSGKIVDNLTIEGNNFTNIYTAAIGLWSGVTGLKILNNFISTQTNGIEIYHDCNDILISENEIVTYSKDYGSIAMVLNFVNGGEITNNTFIEDLQSINEMLFFVYLQSEATNLNIYYNQFYSKSVLAGDHSSNAKDYGTANTWYNPATETGNYWCDFNGTIPYNIKGDALSVDLYPITYVDTDNDGLDDQLEAYLTTSPTSTDSDSDGMPDGWEINNGFNPLIDDSSGDPDNDGLTNLGEYQNNCNPHNSDTDGDHMPDGYEVNYGLNPLVDDAEDDADSDGIDNYTEYIDGTSPTSADTDNDGWTDKEEKDAGTDPLDPNNHPEEGPTDTSFLYIFGIVGLLSMVTLLRKKFNR